MPKHKLAVFLVLVCLVFSFIAPPAYAASPTSSPVKVQISAYGSNEKSERGLFSADFIIPLYYPQDKDTLLFFNPKYSYTTPGADEIHQGLGLRHIFHDSFILGLNAFFDRRLARSGKWYSQVGLGLEYLSHPLDLRLNWYKPQTKSKTIDTNFGFGPNSLIRFRGKEEPLQGLDFEVGVPVFDKYTKTRLYLGGFFYQSDLAKDVNGFRARTETSLTKWLSLDTTFNSRTDGQTEFYGGARVIMPFEWTNLFRKKSKQESPAVPNSYLKDRIFDRVVRDIDIQSKTSITKSKAHDLVYVDNSNAGTEDGSRQHPYNTIQEGVTNAFGDKWVYVGQGSGNYTGAGNSNVTLANSVVLWGSGYNGGFKGLRTSGIAPTIDGAGTGVVVTLGNDNTVMGCKVQNAGTYGIYGTNITGATTIKRNTVTTNKSYGILLQSRNAGILSAEISENTITGNGTTATTDGIRFSSFDTSTFYGTISGNTITTNKRMGCMLDSENASTLTAVVSGNNVSNNLLYGIVGQNQHTSTLVNITSGNTINNNAAGYYLNTYNAGGHAYATISGNTVTGNGIYGIDVQSQGGGQVVSATISGNTVTNNGTTGVSDAGISFYCTHTSALTATVSGNTVTNNKKNGIWVEESETGALSVTISGNRSADNATDGIHVSINNSGLGSLSASLSRNIVTGNLGNGVLANTKTNVHSVIDLGGGTLLSSGYNSIHGNTSFDVSNLAAGFNVTAQHNWWGQDPPDPLKFNGTVDNSNPLSSDPNL